MATPFSFFLAFFFLSMSEPSLPQQEGRRRRLRVRPSSSSSSAPPPKSAIYSRPASVLTYNDFISIGLLDRYNLRWLTRIEDEIVIDD
jgi:hypothetical protein